MKKKKNLEIAGYKGEIRNLRTQFKILLRDIELGNNTSANIAGLDTIDTGTTAVTRGQSTSKRTLKSKKKGLKTSAKIQKGSDDEA